MPRGPRGEKRPADVIGNAVKVMRIATGEETEELETNRAKSAAAELGSRGGKARAAQMTPERRAEIAQGFSQSLAKRSGCSGEERARLAPSSITFSRIPRIIT